MLASTVFPLISLLSLMASASYTCDSTSGLTPEELAAAATPNVDVDSGSGSSGGSGGGSGVCLYADCPYCGSDPTGLMCDNWHKSQLQGGFNSVVGGGGGGTNLFSTFSKRSLHPRADGLDCKDENVCLIMNDLYMCVDPESLDFEDSNGGNGNLDSDMYTMSNGDVTSVASSATSLPTPTGSNSGSGSGTKAKTASGASASATSTSGSAASQQSNSAARNVHVNGMLGVPLVVLGAAGVLL